MFYKVTTYAGDLVILREVIKKNPNFKIGELDILIEKEKNKHHQMSKRKVNRSEVKRNLKNIRK